MIHSVTANIWQFGFWREIVTALFISLFKGRMFSRLTSLALPQDSHSWQGSTRNLWTVQVNIQHA
jgi:hypothetical protein